ncbi:hypothetical protein DTA53_09515 [Salmonella enterica]|uniref:Uncharacterized protein n=1 Tax=Salmonella enterica TaxID=28901 RepID=A0A3R0Q0S8_SALER|nr:hypothetical protein [Salmonella enterica]MJX47134.1 hypothetical protein [Salmonella enterica]
MRSNGPDARHKLPGIRQVKKPILTDGLFCVPAGIHCPMAAPLYPACDSISHMPDSTMDTVSQDRPPPNVPSP